MPFILVVVEILLLFFVRVEWMKVSLYYLIGFTFVFAVLHLVVVLIVKGKS